MVADLVSANQAALAESLEVLMIGLECLLDEAKSLVRSPRPRPIYIG